MEVVTFLLYCVLSLLGIVLLTLHNRHSYWSNKGVPYEKPAFFFGNCKGVGKTRHFFNAFRDTYNKFKGSGPLVGFYFFLRPAAFIIDLDLIRTVLIKEFNRFSDREFFHNERDDPLTGHLFTLDGQKWRSLRNKLSATFTSGKMKFMFPTVVKVSDRFGTVFGEYVENDTVVEIKELLARFTTDVIGTCAFGIECNSLRDPNAEFRVMGRKVFTDLRHNNAVMAFLQSCPKLAKSLRIKLFPDDVSSFFMQACKDTIAYREENNIKRNDFMDMLIDLKQKGVSKTNSGEVISGLTVEECAAQAFVFFLAGFETSSTTMGFCLYELALNQSIQDKLRTEILTILKAHNNELTYESLNEMKYLEQVVHETLRKYSVVVNLFRAATSDFSVPNTNLVIEKGVMVIIPVDAIHHDPEIYPRPSVFDPDRFTPQEIAKRHPMTWLPFGDGPRNCIGLRFGKMQAFIGLVELLKKFRFSVSAKTSIPIEMNPKNNIIGSKGGIYLKVDKL